MAITHQKICFTGGPCSGKTTLINYLAKQGVQTVPEAASSLLEAGAKRIGVSEFRQ